jgi:hypothetical protein
MRIGCVAVLFLLCGCATQPQMMWVRVDNRPDSGQINTAIVQCKGEAAQAAAGTPGPAFPSTYAIVAAHNQRQDTLDMVMQACMSKRGYAWVQAN